MKQRVDWDRHQAAMHQREEEELERERAEYAAIDWHDFSVVETIDYQPWEIGSFPRPTNAQEVGRRVLLQVSSGTFFCILGKDRIWNEQ